MKTNCGARRVAIGGDPDMTPFEQIAAGQNGELITLTVDGFIRRAQVRVSDTMPQGLTTLPVLPEQPSSLTQFDLSTIERERQAEAAD